MLSTNITRDEHGALCFAGQSVPALAQCWGTPLYLMDEARIRANCRMYKNAFEAAFCGAALPLYASKACSFKHMYRIMAEEGMGVDAVSCGEIHTALAAGFPAERIWFHGCGKTDEDIRYGLEKGVGCFVVDGVEELEALNAEAGKRGIKQKVLLRVTGHRPAHLRGGEHRACGCEVRRPHRHRPGPGICPGSPERSAYRAGRSALPCRVHGL